MLKKIRQKAKRLINYLNREKQFEKILLEEGWQKTSETLFEFDGYYRFEKENFILTHNIVMNVELYHNYEKIAEYKQYLTKRDINQIIQKTNSLKIKSQKDVLKELSSSLDNGVIIFPNSELHKLIKNSI